MSNPLVSIIIAAYNEEKNLGECLITLQNQSYKPIEIIVVDDGSTDNTVNIAKTFRIVVIEQSHQGLAKSRNNGAVKANGDILAFLDSDMTFSKNFLKELVTPIIEGKYKGTLSRNEYISNWSNVWARCWNYNRGIPDDKMILDNSKEGSDFRAILKTEFDKVNGFDDIGYNDSWSLPRKLGYKPVYVEGAKYYHSNPDNLKEIYQHAKWVSKRTYKLGLVGYVLVLLKLLPPISFLIGFVKALKFKEAKFVVFKLVYDLGNLLGIIELIVFHKTAK